MTPERLTIVHAIRTVDSISNGRVPVFLGVWLFTSDLGRSHYPASMPCPHRAVLIVTRDVKGTSTSIAQERMNLTCCLGEAHSGKHRDHQFEEDWESSGEKLLTHVLRHQGDEK